MDRARDRLLIPAAVLWLGILCLTVAGSMRWIGRPFPGFLVLENRVVASVGLGRWPATVGGEIYQHEVVTVDGQEIAGAEELHDRIASLPAGTPVAYRLQRGSVVLDRSFATRRFDGADFCLLFGMYLLNGLALGAAGLAIRRWGGGHAASRAAFPVLMLSSLWALTAMDLYGPYRLFRLHALCEVLMVPAILQMAFAFPEPMRMASDRPWLVRGPYAAAAGIALVYQWGLHHPATYVDVHLVATSALGVSLLVLIGAQIGRYVSVRSAETRRQIRILAIGAVVALSLPVLLTIAELLTGGRAPQNALGFTAFLFPLALLYAVWNPRLPTTA